MRRAQRRRSGVSRRPSRRTRKSLALVFALVFASAAARPARAACVEFFLPPAIGSAGGPNAVFVADIDGDGDLDALAASTNDGRIAWFENLAPGNGSSWAVRTISTAASFAQDVAAGDVDGDGDLDALSASLGDDKFAWYENLAPGDGTSWSLHVISTAFDGAFSVAVGDLDRDGDLDVLAAALFGNDLVAFGNLAGDGSVWTVHTLDAVTYGPNSVEAADVDGDADVDALSTSATFGEVAWYKNLGDGTTWSRMMISATLTTPTAATAADVDADGDLDVLAVGTYDTSFRWFENLGAGTGTSWSSHSITTTALRARDIAPLDVDGDGDLDVAVVSGLSGSGNKVAWHENDGTPGDGTWTEHLLTNALAEPPDVATADLDGDGDPDLLSASQPGNSVAWYRNDRLHGEALFVPAATISAAPNGPTDLVSADLDGDGDPDFGVSSYYDDAFYWLENEGASWSTHTVATSTFGGPLAVAASDLDRDGDLDLLGALFETSQINWYENHAESGTWTPHVISTIEAGAIAVGATDIDRDGDDDVLYVASTGPSIGWLENDGSASDGAWTRHAVTTAASGPRDLASGDFDGDGDWDLLFARSTADALLWMEGDDTPRDADPWTTHLVVSGVEIDDPQAVAAADLDRDGDLDAVVAAAGAGVVVAYLNDGDPRDDGWGVVTVGNAGGAVSLDVADVDSDGDPDLVVAAQTDGDALWFENDGTAAAWTARVLTDALTQVRSVIAADFDGDGHVDAASAGLAGDLVEWYRNPGTHVHDDGFDSDGATTACWSTSTPPVP